MSFFKEDNPDLPPPPPLLSKEKKLERQIFFLNKHILDEKRQCIAEMDFLKDENRILLERIRVLMAQNAVLNQRLTNTTEKADSEKNKDLTF
jgi:hypothetical protein